MFNGKTRNKLEIAAVKHSKERDYWLKKLSGQLVKSHFPYDFDLRERETGEEKFQLTGELLHGLIKLRNDSDPRLYIILVTAVAMLLNKYTGSHDIMIGSPVPRMEVEGQLINTVLVLRSRMKHETSFKDLLEQMRRTVTEAVDNQNYPMEILSEQVNIPIRYDDFPLFDIAILLENIHDKKYLQHIKLNMIFSFFRTGKDIEGVVEYNASLYKKSTIKKIIAHFENLLEKVLSNVNLRLANIDILSEEEKKKLLQGVSNAGKGYPGDKTIHQLFESQVEKTRDHIAVVFENSQVSYRELNRRSCRLAMVLREKGVKQDTIVGLLIERSLEMVVGILGILKAGGAYLPIKPDYPQNRTIYMLRESEASLLLTQSELALPYEKSGLDIEMVDVYDEKYYAGNKEELSNINSYNDLAYVMYTSGSTGKSKGVMIEHGNVANFMKGMISEIGFETGKSILALTTVTFDISVLEFLLPLTGGLRIVMAGEYLNKDPGFIKKMILNYGVNLLQVTPSMLSLLVGAHDDLSFLGDIKELMVGGEVFPANLYNRLKNEYSGKIYNLYGPTETTIWSTLMSLTVARQEKISIGSPILNTQVYILDRYKKSVLPGVIGELYIGGSGLARGYLNNPGLTREKFIANPILESKKLYATGDLARWLPDGNIEWLGRIDSQVKIRGNRIELGEIEHLLMQHNGVRECVVLARIDEKGNAYLCAYLVTSVELTVSELRKYLLRDLADYMIPEFFVFLDKMPLNPNGKIDREALPEPVFTRKRLEYAAPGNETEETLVEICSELFGLEKDVIGIDHSFFELGGNSLKIILMASRIHKEFDVKVPVSEMFKKPKISALSRYITGAPKEKFVPIEPAPREEHYQLSPVQTGIFLLQQKDLKSTAYNMPQVVEFEGVIEKKRFKDIFLKLIARHESLRTSFESLDENGPVQKIHESVEFDLEYIDLSINRGKQNISDAGKELVKDFVRPFDLSQAPLLRAGLVKLEKEKHIFMTDMHHIIADGVSSELLLENFLAFYKDEELPDLRVQYRDFLYWQNKDENRKRISPQERYWLKQFGRDIPILDLPADYQRPAEHNFEGSFVSFIIDKESTLALKELEPEKEVTLFIILVAVFNIFLAKISNQQDIIIGIPVDGRLYEETVKIIGMFVNTLALRNSVEPQKSFNAFLSQVKQNYVEAFENQEYQFPDLVTKLKLEGVPGRNPLFDVSYAFQQIDRPEIELPGLKIHPYQYEHNTSKFDLTLVAAEEENTLRCAFEYSTNLFKEETIQRFIKYFRAIISFVARHPARTISEIEILSTEEKNKILNEFNNTVAEYCLDWTVHKLFEEQVDKDPDKIAVVFEDKELKYRELNKRANQLANQLRKKGVKPDTTTAIMVERSIDMIIGIMAILKAGGAYLPIEPNHPEDRIKQILEDSSVGLLLTRKTYSNKLKGNYEVLDLGDDDLYDNDFSNLIVVNTPGNLAYVIYTSGAMGKPKGIMIEHRSVVNLVFGLNERILGHYGDNLRLSLLAPYVFDASVQQIFGALLLGHCLYIAPEDCRLDGKRLLEFYKKHKIEISDGTPYHLSLLLDIEDVSIGNLDIKHFIIGGDVLHRNVIYRFLKKFKNNSPKITNVYGPTECCVDVTSYEVPGDLESLPSIPIGRPMPNISIYILGMGDKLQPIGIPGELCVSGTAVSRGYLKMEELTEKKFVDNPYNVHEKTNAINAKMYLTGDLARWLSDGNIEFLGRKDHQVKIRGYRVEPGEVENQLLNHDRIKSAVIVDKDRIPKNACNRPGITSPQNATKYLYAYIIPDGDVRDDQLKDFLKKRLPSYMIPTFYERVDKFPLTINLKVDRKELQKREPKEKTGGKLPGNEIEEKLVQIWENVIKYEPIGVDDNFFEVGGDSIKIPQILNSINKEFGINLTFKEVCRYLTIAELSSRIQEQKKLERRIKEVEANQTKTLDLSGYDLTEIPESVFQLTHLTELILGGPTNESNKIEEIPQKISQLRNLKKLKLNNNQLKQLPIGIFLVKSLEFLSVRNNNLTELPGDISRLENLQKLDIAYNHLIKLPGEIFQLENLKSLFLSNNRLTGFPKDVSRLKKLRHLDLSSNQLKTLPKEIIALKGLKELNLLQNPDLKTPPYRIVKQGIKAVHKYFQSEEVYDRLFEIKLVLIGGRNFGKSSLKEKMINPNYKLQDGKNKKRLEITPWIIPKEELDLPEDLKINIWDFGEQEISNGTFQFFLTEGSLYLLVTDPIDENDYAEFNYFLDRIRLLGRKSPIIIVLNKADQVKRELPIHRYQRQYNIVDYKKTSCMEGYEDTIETLKAEIKRIIVRKKLFPEILNSLKDPWEKIRKELTNLKDSNVPSISRKEYLDICARYKVDEKKSAFLLGLFHDLGVVIHFNNGEVSLKEIIFLNFEWVTEGIKRTFNDKIVKGRGGVFFHSDLDRIWADDDYKYKHPELLSLMSKEKFDLCFEIEKGKYLIPGLLPLHAPGHEWGKQDDSLHFEYRYKFMPKGILTKLMVKMGNLKYRKNYWRFGILLENEHSRAIVTENNHQHSITITVVGDNKKSFLDEIKDIMDDIHSGFPHLEPQEFVACNCDECKSSDNTHFFNYRSITRRQDKKVPTIQCENSFKPINVDTLREDGKITEPYHLSRVFICYSQKDQVWLDKVCDHLKPLVREKKIEVWSDKCIEPGDEWKKEIEQSLHSANIALLLISPNFYASDFIAEVELPVLLENAKLKGTEIFCLIINPSIFEQDKKLSKYQTIGSPDKPLSSLQEWEIDNYLVDLFTAIKRNSSVE